MKISKQSGNPLFAENTPIRTELLAHDIDNNQNSTLNINTLLKIEKVAIYLEGKGKQPTSVDSFRRHIAVLARHANLDNPQEVELAIARLKLTDPITKQRTNQPASNTYKAKLCFIYKHYKNFYKIDWETPKYVE